MKTTEIRLNPNSGQSRDLVYCERASCDRSLRILCQDRSDEQYKFLLKAYREIISTYLSVRDLVSPISFINSLIRRLESIYQADGLIIADLKHIGLHLVVQEKRTFYLLTTAEDMIHIGRDGRYDPLDGPDPEGIERLDTLKLHTQEELFPQRLQDIFTVSRLTLEPGEAVDCLIGCPRPEVDSLHGAVVDKAAVPEGDIPEQSIESLKRKVLYLRLDASSLPAAKTKQKKREPAKIKASYGNVHSVVVIAICIVVVLAGAVWITGRLGFSPGSSNPGPESRDLQAGPVTAETNPVQEPGRDTLAADPAAEDANRPPADIRLGLGWKNDYSRPVTSSPVVAGENVFFGCRDGHLYALEAASGQLRWKYKSADGIGASPAVSSDRVIGADYTGAVFSLDRETGERIWRRKLPAKVVSSPCLSDNAVFVGCFDGLGYCISLDSGEIIWRRKTGGKLWGSAVYAGGRFIIPSYDGHLYALDAGTGTVAWTYKIGGQLASSPAVSGGKVMVGGPDGRVYAIDVQTGQVSWSFTTGGPIKSGLAAASGRVFVGAHDRHLYCLDAATGQLKWKFEAGGFIFSRPLITDGQVFFGSYDQFLYCLDAATGALVDRYATGGQIYSSPDGSHGSLLFGNNAGEFFSLTYLNEKTL